MAENKITRRSFMKAVGAAVVMPAAILKAKPAKETVYSPLKVDSDVEIELPSGIWHKPKTYEITAIRNDPRIYDCEDDDRGNVQLNYQDVTNMNRAKRFLKHRPRTHFRQLIKFTAELVQPIKPGDLFIFENEDPSFCGEYRVMMIKEVQNN